MASDENVKAVHDAIQRSTYTWRTASGIAGDAGLPVDVALDILNNSPGFVRSSVPNEKGEALFTTRERVRDLDLTSRILSAAANTMTSG
jgi:hypothetical protein